MTAPRDWPAVARHYRVAGRIAGAAVAACALVVTAAAWLAWAALA